MKHWNAVESYGGPWVEIPSFATQCDMSLAAVETAIARYTEAYLEAPTTIIYAESQHATAMRLRDKLREILPFWVSAPCLAHGAMILVGPKGIFVGLGG